jgi:hypothetical protein
MRKVWGILFFVLLAGTSAHADEADQRASEGLQGQLNLLQAQVKELSAVVKAQQRVIDTLQKEGRAVKTAASEPAAPAAPRGRIPFIPDVGVVGDIVGTVSDTLPDDEGNNRFSMRELEVVFGHDVDPYTRFDATLTFSDFEDPDVEEAYASYWNLPFEWKGRIGRMHQYLGKASAIHRDSLDTVDEPLVVQKYLGVEGYFKTGLDLTGFTPLSSQDFTQELTLGLMEGGAGEGGELLADTPTRPSFYSRLKNFWDISEVTSFELGGTYLLGAAEDKPGQNVNFFGLDGTYIHHFNPISKLKLPKAERANSSGGLR